MRAAPRQSRVVTSDGLGVADPPAALVRLASSFAGRMRTTRKRGRPFDRPPRRRAFDDAGRLSRSPAPPAPPGFGGGPIACGRERPFHDRPSGHRAGDPGVVARRRRPRIHRPRRPAPLTRSENPIRFALRSPSACPTWPISSFRRSPHRHVRAAPLATPLPAAPTANGPLACPGSAIIPAHPRRRTAFATGARRELSDPRLPDTPANLRPWPRPAAPASVSAQEGFVFRLPNQGLTGCESRKAPSGVAICG